MFKPGPDISVQKGGRTQLEFSKEKNRRPERVFQVYTLNFGVM